MNYWKVILATIVIYGAGVMSGGLLVNHVIVRPNPRMPHRPEGPAAFGAPPFQTNFSGRQMFRGPRQPEMLSRQFLEQLDERLHLTSDQRDAIQKIITEGQNLMRKTMQDTRLEIREQLTPEQRLKWVEELATFLRLAKLGGAKPDE